MEAFTLTIRSIAAELFSRIFLPGFWSVFAVFLLLFAGTFWLISQSAWWWILFAVILLWALIATALLAISWSIIKGITPERTPEQKKKTKLFVDKAQGLAEITGTPKFILVFRIVRDAMHPSKQGYLSSVAGEGTALQKDFIDLKRSFEK